MVIPFRKSHYRVCIRTEHRFGCAVYNRTGGLMTGLSEILASQGQASTVYDVCVPLLRAGAVISQLDYNVIWRYFRWSNQTLAMIALWTASMYLYKNKKCFWVTAIPATFMSAVSVTYFFYAPECLHLSTAIAYPVGVAAAVVFLFIFLFHSVFKKEKV